MSEPINPLAIALGTYYPKHYMVAVFHDPCQAMQALTALQDAAVERGVARKLCQLCPPGAPWRRSDWCQPLH